MTWFEALIRTSQMQSHCAREAKAKQTGIVTWPVCMFVLSPQCFGFNTHWKALTNPQQCSLWMWPYSPPMDLWKQTQSQGQVLLLSCRHFPTSSILPLTLISTLIWSKSNCLLKFHEVACKTGANNKQTTFSSGGLEHLQVIHCHLQYFRLL